MADPRVVPDEEAGEGENAEDFGERTLPGEIEERRTLRQSGRLGVDAPFAGASEEDGREALTGGEAVEEVGEAGKLPPLGGVGEGGEVDRGERAPRESGRVEESPSHAGGLLRHLP